MKQQVKIDNASDKTPDNETHVLLYIFAARIRLKFLFPETSKSSRLCLSVYIFVYESWDETAMKRQFKRSSSILVEFARKQ